ncbi:ATP-dependent DNA helicase PIF1 [Hirsutella rhossiliensis]|uniref:ATP-dependent DNA helicase PIF1 n=1 Tax=Hirsutella rhossiliensis TaxID=111463 RepID=A0A9P8SFW6_9HYPO|nr:ATP-dependent DNA helicase PIF1 [Hirsutella rhossiliensis]KAH0961353.1 ATP-dependent DNA helicase PIF1 [Hirsutella rhossiliensis]
MRRKIQSLIVGYGVPAIWFTINPNDITNPVKLRLAAYRTRDPDAAEEFLEGLGDAYKRARLAISDPMSSAVFFHREMKLFFDHYVKVGEESVFGRIGKYYGAVETNERGRFMFTACSGCTGTRISARCLPTSTGRIRRRIASESSDTSIASSQRIWTRKVLRRASGRSVTGGIGSLLDNAAQFSAAFIEEANFCAGATQEGGRGPLPVQGAMEIRRTHSMVNRWNEAIAVGLRHNHDISFIATQRKTMALIYYVTNYATKVEDPVWKRVAAAAELLAASTGDGTANGGRDGGGDAATDDPVREQDATVPDESGEPRVHGASAITGRGRRSPSRISGRVHRQQRVGVPELFSAVLEVFRRWRHLREASGAAAMDDTLDESVLRRPGKHATVCLDGYLSKDFTYDDESCYRRAAVQHLALFVPWSPSWAKEQLLRRSAEDAKRDAKQWAASSGDGDPTVAHVEEGGAGEAGAESAATYQPNSIGDATRLIDVVRGAVGANQVTAKSPELMAMIQQLCRFQQSALRSTAELEATALIERGEAVKHARAGIFRAALPPQDQVKAIKSQQSIAFLIICRQLDLMQQTDGAMPASCASSSAERFIHGQSRMDWQEKDVLVIDEISGGSPSSSSAEIFSSSGRSKRSIVLPSAAISWDVDNSFKAEQRHQHDKAHALWKRFTTVVMLDEQMRAAGDPELQRLLKRIRLGVQDRTDLNLLNSRNRWNLNMEASLAFRVQQRSTMRIFISEHKWKEELPTEEEAIMILNQGDDSAIPVPAVFMFVAGMPIVVNHNTHQGLKLVNGASYSAVEVIVDKAYPGHRISADMTIHFGPPAGIILESETTRYLHFCQRKRPWQRNDVSRKGLPCAAAFACTDYKVQGKTLERVALELRGHGRRRWMERWCPRNGIMLVSKVRDRDLVGNRVPEEMTAAQARLEVLSERTVEEALRWLDGDAEESRRPR